MPRSRKGEARFDSIYVLKTRELLVLTSVMYSGEGSERRLKRYQATEAQEYLQPWLLEQKHRSTAESTRKKWLWGDSL